MQIRSILAHGAIALGAGLGLAAPGSGAQAAYPDHPIKLVVPFPPAGGTDVLTRLVANEVTLKQQWTFVVDNKPGAGGNIGLEAVAKARKDGYTLGAGQTANLAINPALYTRMPFDAGKDFAPVILLASQPVVLVVKAGSPIKTLADLKSQAQARQLTRQLAAVPIRTGDRAGHQADVVGHVGEQRRVAERNQRGEGDQRAGTDDRVDRACRGAREEDGDEVCERHGRRPSFQAADANTTSANRKAPGLPQQDGGFLEATMGIEPMWRALQALASATRPRRHAAERSPSLRRLHDSG